MCHSRLLLAWMLGALLGCGAAEDPQPTARPNVLLISIDSLRADHLSCYGYERPTSPAIDALALEGVRFAKVSSTTSWTLPAHASMFTGLPITLHGCNGENTELVPGRQTLAETLAADGYATAGFWSGPYLHPVFGLGQGFEDYVNCANFEYYTGRRLRGQRRANVDSHKDITSPRILENVDAWLRQRDARPFFLFVHMWDVHFDYLAPAPYDTMFDPDYTGEIDGIQPNLLDVEPAARDLEHLIALYDGEIAWTDKHVGLLLGLLDELGIADDTVVMLTSDHGEEFFEHGRFGHRQRLFLESVDVPLIVRAPGRFEAGSVVLERVSVLDIPATILDIIALPPWEDVLGRSLLPSARKLAGERAAIVVSELYKRKEQVFHVSLRDRDWAVLYERESRRLLGLWNTREDPSESTNLAEDGGLPVEVEGAFERALAELERLRESNHLSPADGAEAAEVPADVLDSLRELGYLGDDEYDDE